MIFDMDGVLVDSHPAHYRAWQRFLQHIGKSEENLHIIYEGRKREEILRSFVGHDIAPTELKNLGRLKDELFQEESSLVEPIPGVAKLLEALKVEGVRCAVATSAARPRCTSMLENLNLLHYFEVVVAGCDVDAGKPDPTIYRKAVEALEVEAHNTLAVEDAVSGIAAARGADLRCHLPRALCRAHTPALGPRGHPTPVRPATLAHPHGRGHLAIHLPRHGRQRIRGLPSLRLPAQGRRPPRPRVP